MYALSEALVCIRIIFVAVSNIWSFEPGAFVPTPTLLVVVMVDAVIVDVAFNVLTFNVEYAATPGAPLLILETVRVDKDNELVVIVDPVRVE